MWHVRAIPTFWRDIYIPFRAALGGGLFGRASQDSFESGAFRLFGGNVPLARVREGGQARRRTYIPVSTPRSFHPSAMLLRSMRDISEFAKFFGLAFSALLPVVNPLGSALVFL